MLPFWKIMLTAKTHYMCGDYNVDLLKVTDRQFNDDYFNHILSAGYIPKVTLPTRLSDNSTLIDNVFTTNLNTDLSAYILDIHISDHQPVILFTNEDLPPTRSKYITIRANTDDRKDHFRQCFHNKHVFDQLDKDIHNTDPNHNYDILEHAIKETHSECFPERRVKFNAKKHNDGHESKPAISILAIVQESRKTSAFRYFSSYSFYFIT